MEMTSIQDLTDPSAIPNDVKFNAELDFMNLLGDITYVYFLVESSYTDDARFVAYLKYLEYWQYPRYAMLLRSSYSLYYMRKLQDRQFVYQLSAKVQLGEWDNSCSITYLDYLKYTALYGQQNQKFIEGQEQAVERGKQ